MGHYTRHEEFPVFEHRTSSLDANRFNRASLALKRAGGSLRIELPTLRHLDLILQDDAWIVVDRELNDVPLVAWIAFEVNAEQRLHRPVGCRLRLFHAQAGLLLGKVLDDLAGLLDQQLAGEDSERGQVLRFPEGDE